MLVFSIEALIRELAFKGQLLTETHPRIALGIQLAFSMHTELFNR